MGLWGGFWQSLLLSYGLGAAVTVLNIIIGLPTAVIIARKKAGKFMSSIFDLLVNVPLVVPSIALGVSLAIFWKSSLSLPDVILLVLAHLAITYPYFVRSMSSALERISPDMEEAARTLGAKPLGVFRTIVFPLTKYSLLSGAIMVFTRSVSETGATIAVTSNLVTAPVLLVSWIRENVPSLDIALASGSSEKEVEEAWAINSNLYKIIMTQPDQRKAAKEAMEWYSKDIDSKGLTPDERKEQMAAFTRGIVQVNNAWWRYWLPTDPAVFWKGVKCPVLALNGDKDLQVNYEQNLPAIKAAMVSGGNKKIKTVILPGHNHLFQHCTTGTPAEYTTIEETFSSEALDIITKWIKKTMKVK